MRRVGLISVRMFAVLVVLPVTLQTAYWVWRGWPAHWRLADYSSVGDLPSPAGHPAALVRIYCARLGGWRGAVAKHCWIVFKEEGARAYTRYDVLGWGETVRRNAYVPDGRWHSNAPETVYAVAGTRARAAIADIEAAIRAYPYRHKDQYRAWPGPNSNTFVAYVIRETPELDAVLPPGAVGKDYPVSGRWVASAPSKTGWRITLGGYAGITLAAREGAEVNLLGLTLGLGLSPPAVKLPGLGWFRYPGSPRNPHSPE